SSQRSHTAVHEQQGAGDIGGIVGGQKQDRGGDLLGPAWALQHGALCGLGVILLDGLASRRDAALMERREDRARADGVHTNALRRVVGGERPRQARDRGPLVKPWKTPRAEQSEGSLLPHTGLRALALYRCTQISSSSARAGMPLS